MRSLRFTRITCHCYLYLIGETFPTRIIRIRIRLQNNRNGKVAFRIQLHRIRNKRYGPISPISPVAATGNGICQRNILNCRPVICLDIACYIHRISQAESLLHRIKGNLKGRPFVILHPYGNGSVVFYINCKVTIQADCRQHKFCGEGTEFIGTYILLYQFFPVDVQQTYLITLPCQNVSLVRLLFISDTLDINGLTGTIQGAVCQQGNMLFRTRLSAFVISVQINILRHHGCIRSLTHHITADSLIPFHNRFSTGTGDNCFHQLAVFFIVSRIETDLCTGNGLPTTAVHRNHFHLIIRQRKRQHLEAGRDEKVLCSTGRCGIRYNLQYIYAQFVRHMAFQNHTLQTAQQFSLFPAFAVRRFQFKMGS